MHPETALPTKAGRHGGHPVASGDTRPEDEIRLCLIRAREQPDDADRDALVSSLLARAMIEARREDAATEAILADRYGFTAEELTAHGRAARDKATIQWMRRSPCGNAADLVAA